MARAKKGINPVRASRDGHEYHENWIARKSMQLLLQDENLVGIAVEGLSPVDELKAKSETVEIADATLYYGEKPSFKEAERVVVTQFKYSISKSEIEFRASDAKKTITKFAQAYKDLSSRFGSDEVHSKLSFELITNRPIYKDFQEALIGIARSETLTGVAKKQAEQVKRVVDLEEKQFIHFVERCTIVGLTGNLSEIKKDTARTVVNWSSSNDAIARIRLGALRQLARDKAGYAGSNNNIIRRVDIFGCLDISDEDELFPCLSSLPEINKVVIRSQQENAVTFISKSDAPVLLTANGGVGKTVFLSSLRERLSQDNEVLLFDCFGGGTYRSPEDSRHLPKRGLVHIANTLACRSLCDPMLPGNSNSEELFKTFRKRIKQAISTIKKINSNRNLILILDAIDNAAEHAKDRNEDSFPTLLLESLSFGDKIEGFKVVASCRPYRKQISIKEGTKINEFVLLPFDYEETELFLNNNIKNVSDVEAKVAFARSGGNPRILEHLTGSNRGLLDISEIQKTIDLNDLINERISSSLSDIYKKGYKQSEIQRFLAGLSVLPPAIPVDEFADIFDIEESLIESFAADLAPLLERTKFGIIFRDEPTETFVKKEYGSSGKSLNLVAENLFNKQEKSVYATRALPGLLQKIGATDKLFELAFDQRFPSSVSSSTGKRAIRLSRLKAALKQSLKEQNYEQIIPLMIELSSLVSINQRGTNYLLSSPDLTALAKDIHSFRRLFETRTTWGGARHSRLAIANTLLGDFHEATRNIQNAREWVRHYVESDRQRKEEDNYYHKEVARPDKIDIAAIPFGEIVQGNVDTAISFISIWKDWYGYEFGEYLFSFLKQFQVQNPNEKEVIDSFLDSLSNEFGMLTSALVFMEEDSETSKKLIRKLATLSKKSRANKKTDREWKWKNQLQYGLLKTSALATLNGFDKEALKLQKSIRTERPRTYTFSSHQYSYEAAEYFIQKAIIANTKKQALKKSDFLPDELWKIVKGKKIKETDFWDRVKEEIDDEYQLQLKNPENKRDGVYRQKEESGKFLNTIFSDLFNLTNVFKKTLNDSNDPNQAFVQFLEKWKEINNKSDNYSPSNKRRFFEQYGASLGIFTLWVRKDLNQEAIEKFIVCIEELEFKNIDRLIFIVSILSGRSSLHELAGKVSLKAKILIDQESDIDERGPLCIKLSRALFMASSSGAIALYKQGLELMDSIGSGDYWYISELLHYATKIKGEEVSEQHGHILTNLCELNMPYDEEKFPWSTFGMALSNVMGIKTLSKLSRWDDRGKIRLEYTLRPFLYGLIYYGKICPELALSLNLLAKPVELYGNDTKDFVALLKSKDYSNMTDLILESLKQYEMNLKGFPYGETLEFFSTAIQEIVGFDSEWFKELQHSSEHFEKVRIEENKINYPEEPHTKLPGRLNEKEQAKKRELLDLSKSINPIDALEISKVLEKVNEREYFQQIREFLGHLRLKVSFSDRAKYISVIAGIANLGYHLKIWELKACKKEWGPSSLGLNENFQELSGTLITLHIDELIENDRFSSYDFTTISKLTGVGQKKLTIQLVQFLINNEIETPGSVWLSLASNISEELSEGIGQKSLVRLLQSSAIELARNVEDGEWTSELYLENDEVEVSASLIWHRLGSPYAEERWRAGHSIRCLAKFNRWDTIESIVNKARNEKPNSFLPSEFKFFYLHAKLWLLISLARLALDYPEEISNFKEFLFSFLLDDNEFHVLIKNFAASALLSCHSKGGIELSENQVEVLENVNLSILEKVESRFPKYLGIHPTRSKEISIPNKEYFLDIDFRKYQVNYLSDLFDVPFSVVECLVIEVADLLDSEIEHMYENNGRPSHRRDRYHRMSDDFHTYGHYIGWHSLFITAGILLSKVALVEDEYDENPWKTWLKGYTLSNDDGLWLSDGNDRVPINTKVNLLERKENKICLTGDENILKALVGIESSVIEKIVVKGSFNSGDNVSVLINSSLIDPKNSSVLIKKLLDEQPFHVWLPSFEIGETEEEYTRNKIREFEPWLSQRQVESGIDEHDPFGVARVIGRPMFSKEIQSKFKISSEDSFNRYWKKLDNKIIAQSEAWGYEDNIDSSNSNTGVRLSCKPELISEILSTLDKKLLILIKLERYETGEERHSSGKFSHTIALAEIDKHLKYKFHIGAVNHIHKNRL